MHFCLIDLPGLIQRWKEEAEKGTGPRWAHLRRFLREIEALAPTLEPYEEAKEVKPDE